MCGLESAVDDYLGGSGILTFEAGDTQQDVLIFIVNDEDSESTESFFVDLSLLDGTFCENTTIMIMDNEPTSPPPTTPRVLIVTVYCNSLIFIITLTGPMFTYSSQSDDCMGGEQVYY